MADQYLRKFSLVVSAGSKGLDLSDMQVRFTVTQNDVQTPNGAAIRIYNLSDATSQKIEKEFTHVTMQAGYQTGNYGTIFEGTIVQVRRGKENPTDTYLDIIGADGDEAYISGIVNSALAAGSTFKDRVDAIGKALEPAGVKVGYVAEMPDDKLPRGKVLYGAARDHLDDIANATGTRWSIQAGQLQFISIEGYLPGEAVVLNSLTGMIGLPEQTADGIRARCLLNPKIKVGGRVQIDNKSIQKQQLDTSVGGVANNAFIPSIADDGFYRTLVVEYEGDTRGNPWYSNLVMVKVDAASPPSQASRGRT